MISRRTLLKAIGVGGISVALMHSAAHMGEAVTVRTAGGFGTGM